MQAIHGGHKAILGDDQWDVGAGRAGVRRHDDRGKQRRCGAQAQQPVGELEAASRGSSPQPVKRKCRVGVWLNRNIKTSWCEVATMRADRMPWLLNGFFQHMAPYSVFVE